MDILFASSNQHKLEEMQALLPQFNLHLPKEFAINFECEETGTTFAQNAMQKALALQKQSNLDMFILADDSGLLVDALPGELGVRTARFGSKDGDPILSAEEKNILLLKRLKDQKNRNAHFVCSLVLITDQRIIQAEGIAPGYIKEDISLGTGGFGYDPVFFNTEANACFADMGKEKNKYSHRAKAVKQLLEKLNQIPKREEISDNNKWDLSQLYKTQEDFQKDLEKFRAKIQEVQNFKSKISKSPKDLLQSLEWAQDVQILSERLANYAFLNYSTQMDCEQNQINVGLYSQISTQLSGALSFINPAILEIKDIESWIEDKAFDDFRISLKKLLRSKKHILSDKEEAILSKQGELQSTPNDVFEALTDSDMDFGMVNNKALSQSTYSIFLQNPDRAIRKQAYTQFYANFQQHEQTLSKLYASSVKQDIFNAKVRGFNTSLEASLFQDDVPTSVYTNLIETVHKAFPILHRYYSLKKQILKLDELRHYDVYMPMAQDVKISTPYQKACQLVKDALSPLGEEYTSTLYKGLTSDRWADIYENKSKRSGAFSSGGFIGNPYILLNYKDDVITDVFTVAHEGGHSMHTLYSKLNNPFSCYNYTIFEAEVASTFNEQLLANHLMQTVKDPEVKKFIISKQLDDIVATLFRQTMFAEFELICHKQQENGEILTSQSIRANYKSLLEQYFGKEMVFEENSDLECLRIPHFYNAFYVYKYATGISAAISLSQNILNADEQDKIANTQKYLNFLQNGGRYFPIQNLKFAGVDMTTPNPVNLAIEKFSKLLDQRSKML